MACESAVCTGVCNTPTLTGQQVLLLQCVRMCTAMCMCGGGYTLEAGCQPGSEGGGGAKPAVLKIFWS